ncbi:MAG: class I SAM-dependent methyltransferase [Methylococcales bacterium]|nr:class I SAM-dependent methyltransferase [Methylococcales bacterium]
MADDIAKSVAVMKTTPISPAYLASSASEAGVEMAEDKTVDDICGQLDQDIEAAEKGAVNDDDLRVRLSGISSDLKRKFAYLPSVGDPLSSLYLREVELIHRQIIGRPYSVKSEGLPDLNQDWEVQWGFPYGTKSSSTVGGFLIAYGYIIKMMGLPAGSRILEVGCGLGSFTFLLAKMGYKVDALDISGPQCAIVQKVVENLPEKPNVICSSLEVFLASNTEKYDAIVFFESFHHFLNHANLLALMAAKHLAPSGKMVLAGEPIFQDYEDSLPYPWGVRLDGESLRAMRKWGWLELGFTETYIKNLFARTGLSYVRHKEAISPWADVIIGADLNG